MKKVCYLFLSVLFVLSYTMNAFSDELYTEEKDYGDLKVVCNLSSSHKEVAAQLIQHTKDAYDLFSNLYGDIGLKRINILETSDLITNENGETPCAVVSALGFIEVSPGFVETCENVSDDGTIAHEVSHFWWGWIHQSNEHWLSEGMADFSKNYFLDKMHIREMKTSRLYNTNSYIFNEQFKEADDIALYDYNREKYPFSTSDYRREIIAYIKGSYVFDMLRTTLGDEQFFAVMRKFNQHENDTTSKDLENTISEVTGNNLDWFFNQWVYKTGYPKLDFQYQIFKKKGATHLVISIQQTDSIFRLKLPLVVETTKGNRKYLLDINEKNNKYDFVVDAKVTKVMLDPEFCYLKYVDGDSLALISKAKKALEQGKITDATKFAESALNQNPSLPSYCLSICAQAFERNALYDKAFRLYEKIYKENEKDASSTFSVTISIEGKEINLSGHTFSNLFNLLHLADLAYEAKLYTKAKESYLEILKFAPVIINSQAEFFLAQAYSGLGRISLLEGKNKEANKYSTDALTYYEILPDARLCRALANLNLKNLDIALTDCNYLAGIKKNLTEPQLAKLYLLYGNIYDFQGKRDEAIANYKEVLKLNGEQEDIEAAKQGIKKAFKE